MEILFFQRLSWPCLERRSQCRDVAAERRAEGKDKTHQDAHENYDPGDEIPWRNKLDDGWPESVEEQFLLVLISRQYITKQYIKDVLQADKKNSTKRTYYKTTNRRWINVKKRRFHRKSKQMYIKSSTSDTFTRSYCTSFSHKKSTSVAVGAFMAVGALGALTSKFVVVVGLSKLQPCHYVAMWLARGPCSGSAMRNQHDIITICTDQIFANRRPARLNCGASNCRAGAQKRELEVNGNKQILLSFILTCRHQQPLSRSMMTKSLANENRQT